MCICMILVMYTNTFAHIFDEGLNAPDTIEFNHFKLIWDIIGMVYAPNASITNH